MRFHVLTLFPEMIEQGIATSILGRAMERGLLSLEAVNIRDYTASKHKKVDDYTYGGGAGMLMQAQPVYDAWQAVQDRIGDRKARVVYMTPQGAVFNQSIARELAQEEDLSRMIPGVLNNHDSAETDSFMNGLLEYPQYSRPEEWRGRKVPEILLSGDHAKVDAWRLDQSVQRTRERRPDLYQAFMEAHPDYGKPKKKRRKKTGDQENL